MKKCNRCKQEKELTEFHKNPRKADGLCGACKTCESIRKKFRQFSSLKKEAKPFVEEGYSYCIDCEQILQISCFSINKAYKSGIQPRCRACTKEYKYHIYNFNTTKYVELLEQQEYKCAGCKRHISELTDKLHVDHDHNDLDKKVRGLLCAWCNRGLGLLRDNIQTLQNLIVYLEK